MMLHLSRGIWPASLEGCVGGAGNVNVRTRDHADTTPTNTDKTVAVFANECESDRESNRGSGVESDMGSSREI